MASGDAQRVWFPEMLEALKAAWSPTWSWDDTIAFCRRMTDARRRIRDDRGIKPPLMRCPRCGRTSRSDNPGVSIRSALFALRNGQILSEVEFHGLDADWKRYRRINNLDAFGNVRELSLPHARRLPAPKPE